MANDALMYTIMSTLPLRSSSSLWCSCKDTACLACVVGIRDNIRQTASWIVHKTCCSTWLLCCG